MSDINLSAGDSVLIDGDALVDVTETAIEVFKLHGKISEKDYEIRA